MWKGNKQRESRRRQDREKDKLVKEGKKLFQSVPHQRTVASHEKETIGRQKVQHVQRTRQEKPRFRTKTTIK